MFYLNEFYIGVKNSKFALLYTSLLLIRRSVFIVILFFFDWVSIHVFYPMLLLIQFIYFTQVVIFRHFQQTRANIIEIINE